MSYDVGRHRPPAPHRTHSRPTSRAVALTVLATGALTGALLIGVVESAGTGTPHPAHHGALAPSVAAHVPEGEVLLAPADTAQRGSRAAQRSTVRPAVSGGVAQRVLAESARAAAGLGRAVRLGDFSLGAGVDTAAAGREQVAKVAAAQRLHRPILEGTRTSSYGWRWGRMHQGMDIAAEEGTPLYAVGPGTVTTAGWNPGLGNHAKVTLVDGTVLVYGHLSILAVEVDDPVVGGTLLGEVGSTGRSTGAHLHLEVRVDDEPQDPGPWLDERFGPDGR